MRGSKTVTEQLSLEGEAGWLLSGPVDTTDLGIQFEQRWERRMKVRNGSHWMTSILYTLNSCQPRSLGTRGPLPAAGTREMPRRPPTVFQKCYKSHFNFISSTPYRWKKRAHLATSTCSPRGTSCKSDATVHDKFPAPPSPLRSHSSLPSRALSYIPSPSLTSY